MLNGILTAGSIVGAIITIGRFLFAIYKIIKEFEVPRESGYNNTII